MNTNANIEFHIGVYQTADNYQAPRVQAQAANNVGILLKAYIKHALKKPADITIIDFSQILGWVYQVTAARDENSRLRKTVLDIIITEPATTSTGPPGALTSIMTQCARAIPDFGRDMYLRMMEDPSDLRTFSHIQIVEEVQCPDCANVWLKPKDWERCRCMHCAAVRDWGLCLTRRDNVMGAFEAMRDAVLGEDSVKEDDDDDDEERRLKSST